MTLRPFLNYPIAITETKLLMKMKTCRTNVKMHVWDVDLEFLDGGGAFELYCSQPAGGDLVKQLFTIV